MNTDGTYEGRRRGRELVVHRVGARGGQALVRGQRRVGPRLQEERGGCHRRALLLLLLLLLLRRQERTLSGRVHAGGVEGCRQAAQVLGLGVAGVDGPGEGGEDALGCCWKKGGRDETGVCWCCWEECRWKKGRKE